MTKGHILAYHWKLKENFSCLIKVRYSRAKISIIIAYMLIAISIGIVGSLIVSFLQAFIAGQGVEFAIVTLVIAVILFGLGLFVGGKVK